jgi:hypothetical protein
MTSMEAFVRATGLALGSARDAFGVGRTTTSPGSTEVLPGQPVSAAGRWARAAADEAAGAAVAVTTLAEHDRRADGELRAAAAAAATGRGELDGLIDGAAVDVDALAPAVDSPAGRRALVEALTRRLRASRQALEDGATDASTRAAAAQSTAADYGAAGRFWSAAVGAAGGAPPPVGGGGAMSAGGAPLWGGLAPLAALFSTTPAAESRSSGGAGASATAGGYGDNSVAAAAIPISSVGFHRLGFAGGRDAYRGYISQALDVLGIADPQARARWTAGLLVGVGRESGFSPEAVNRSDSNAHGALMPDGAPAGSSRGGMQTIPATFAAHHQPNTSADIYDPVANLCAGMNYLMRRYSVSRDGSNLVSVHQFNPRENSQGY